MKGMVLPSKMPLFFVFVGVAAVGSASLVSACSDGTTGTPVDADSPDGSSTPTDGAADNDARTESDPTKDAETKKPERNQDGPGEEGAVCGFNHDCKLALRCACDEDTGCKCQPGARGKGKNGVDACVTSDDCASALCIEGPVNGESICSDECEGPDDCTGKLPRCIEVVGIPAPVCVREPPP